jgi:hypothetical protein
MEQDLFTWQAWCLTDAMTFFFYDHIEFVKDFGPIKKGDKFSGATVNYGDGCLVVFDTNGDVVHTIKIEVTVKETP